MKTSRLRSNFGRKHFLRKRRQTRKKRVAKRVAKRVTKRVTKRSKTHRMTIYNKNHTMRGGSMGFKKENLYDVYGNPVNEVTYSIPIQGDD